MASFSAHLIHKQQVVVALNVNEVVATLIALHGQLPGPPLLHL